MTLMRLPDAAMRPTLHEYDTIAIAVAENKQAIMDWTYRNGFSHGETEESILDGVTSAMSQSKAEPARACRLMEMTFRWKVDDAIIWHLSVVQKNLPLALNLRIIRWVIETGVRFPANEGDFIVFATTDHQHRNGRVTKLVPLTGAALVEGENGTVGTVYCENVITNQTCEARMVRALPLRDQRLPSFGQRRHPPVVGAA